MSGIQETGVYGDMLRRFVKMGHAVFVASPVERRQHLRTEINRNGNSAFLCVRTLNNTKINLLEKAFALLTTPLLLYYNIRKFYRREDFDLILYSTPPVTIAPVVKWLKKQYVTKNSSIKAYCLLKDIWPQTAVDLGAIKKGSIGWRYLDAMEKQLYAVSDVIGCMSAGNVEYVRTHNPEVPAAKLEVCPNGMEPRAYPPLSEEENADMRSTYGIPQEALLLVYGGSFGIPQGISFILQIIESYKEDWSVYFLFIGAGTEFETIERWIRAHNPTNVQLLRHMPMEQYQLTLRAADVGLVFLSRMFSTPNMPSRALDYMNAMLPVLAAVDKATDFGTVIRDGGFGLFSLSGELSAFKANLNVLRDKKVRLQMGQSAWRYLGQYWTAQRVCGIIVGHLEGERDGNNKYVQE